MTKELLKAAKPILFNTEMVKAILDGRKTVTRRLVKPTQLIGLGCDKCPDNLPREYIKQKKMLFKPWCDMADNELIGAIYKPTFELGDILYVRETVWQKIGHYLDVDGETKGSYYNKFLYVATDEEPETGWNYSWVKRPSIHMPKEAARIFLKVADVRAERLQEIDAVGCLQEGIESEYPHVLNGEEKRYAFSQLWNSTIKKSDIDTYGWNANPWVWVIEFERCEKPDEFAGSND